MIGLDVSYHQGHVDWERVHATEARFCFIRASISLKLDLRFTENWEGARGLARGAYHFLYADQPGDEQARMLLAQIEDEPGELPPVVDMEELSLRDATPDHAVDVAVACARTIAETIGVRPILYTNPNTALLLGEAIARLHEHMPTLWLADYRPRPITPWPWDTWEFWQLGVGRMDGVATNVDLDRFEGTEDDLRMIWELNRVLECR